MKNKVQHLSQNNQIKFDWALNLCHRDQQKMNLNSMSNNEREITFNNEQRKLKNKKTLFNSTKSIINYLRYESSLVTFYIPKLDMLEISYTIIDESTMVIKTTDKKSEVFCLFKVTKEESKYRLEFIKVDYVLTKFVEKTLRYA